MSRPASAAPARRGSDRRPPTAQSRGADRFVVAGAVVAVIAFLAAVLVLTRDDDDDSREHRSAGQTGMEHVHGLGVDPADGTLYAGTHHGLFRVPEQGPTERVADGMQDLMGFTVVGPQHYLASGHPAAGGSGPAALGLVETTDGGRTWRTLSLEGAADFHALESRHGRVYGWNAGEFMVSEDARTWEVRSKLLLADFAVHPSDPDTLLATTQQGLGISDDGGRTFGAVRGSPPLYLVAWADNDVVVGVGQRGDVHVSADDGQTWERRGSAGGAPTALTATKDQVFVAVERGIVVSGDGGRSFSVRYQKG